MKEVFEFLKKCNTYYLATVEGDQPRVRPFGTAHIFEDKLYIQTGKVKEVSKQIQANAKVEICAFADGAVAVAAYSYMALVPVIQPPIMKLLTTEAERKIVMKPLRNVTKREKIVFPIMVTVFVALLVPSAGPLIACLMLGNLFKECGVTDRLSKTVQNELMNIVTILLRQGQSIYSLLCSPADCCYMVYHYYMAPLVLSIFPTCLRTSMVTHCRLRPLCSFSRDSGSRFPSCLSTYGRLTCIKEHPVRSLHI